MWMGAVRREVCDLSAIPSRRTGVVDSLLCSGILARSRGLNAKRQRHAASHRDHHDRDAQQPVESSARMAVLLFFQFFERVVVCHDPHLVPLIELMVTRS